jgi:hypothetical protein
VRRFRLALLVTFTAAGLLACSVSRTGAPKTSASPTSTTETTTTSSDGQPEPPEPNDEPITSNAADCVDAECRVVVAGPMAIPLDTTRYHYPELRITAVAADSMTVVLPDGASGTTVTLGVGDNSAFNFQNGPSVWLTLETVVNGTAVLNLTPGDPL